MRVLVTGSSGLIGRALRAELSRAGHEVLRLVRREPAAPSELRWDPAAGLLAAGDLEAAALDAVVNLAGESIAEGRWTPEKKARIRSSRVEGTRLLARQLAVLERRPAVLLTASAIGYYGDRGPEPVSEESPPGRDFLAEVCVEWEAAADPARDAGIRVAATRFGIVLSRDGGALPRMLPLFRMGVGGPLGNGRQWMSWVALDDVTAALLHLLEHQEVEGPVNVVSPHPVPNAEFARTLARVVRRPVGPPAPAFVLRLVLGEFADQVLLAGQRVLPARLEDSGYRFRFPELEPALRGLLG